MRTMQTLSPPSSPARRKGTHPKGVIPAGLAGYQWKAGQSGNPKGFSGLYGEAIKIARAASPDAVRRLIELSNSDDERVAAVACNSILDRAWGKPKDYDPKAEKTHERPPFNPRDYTSEELNVIEAGLRLMLRQPAMIEADREGSA